jgi:hypothetical protein
VEQNRIAKDHGLSFYRTAGEIRAAVDHGALVELMGDANYDVANFVRYPYLHPVAALFVERLAAQYYEACGQKLVVTSAVRPTSGQPRNAHRLSVHPAGMAVDLRVSDRASCRSWLESALLNMERQGLLNGIREFHPPHYHVAIYPDAYMAHAQERMAEESQARALAEAEAEAAAAVAAALRSQVSPEYAAAGVDAAAARGSRSRIPLAATLALLLGLPLGQRVAQRRRERA